MIKLKTKCEKERKQQKIWKRLKLIVYLRSQAPLPDINSIQVLARCCDEAAEMLLIARKCTATPAISSS